MGILLDDNNRKPLARLHFNNKTTKYLDVFDGDRREERIIIHDLNDIYTQADKLRRVLAFYEKSEPEPSSGDQTCALGSTPKPLPVNAARLRQDSDPDARHRNRHDLHGSVDPAGHG